MNCPKCGSANLSGKMLCYKCGASLRETGEGKVLARGSKDLQKKIIKVLCIALPLVALGTLAGFMLQRPDTKGISSSSEAAERFEAKLVQAGKATKAKKPFKTEITSEEINSFVVSKRNECAWGLIELDDIIQANFQEGGFSGVFSKNIKVSPLYISLSGKLVLVDDKLVLYPQAGHIGKLPIPRMLLEQLKSKGWRISLFSFPKVREMRIEGDKLIIEAGPKVKVKPKKPKKRVLTPEERKKQREKMQENEANSWLQLGNNLIKIRRYDTALTYYHKIIKKYPNRPQAVQAREQIEKIKIELGVVE